MSQNQSACRADNESHYKPPVKATLAARFGCRPERELNGSGPDPFPPPLNKRERVGYAILYRQSSELNSQSYIENATRSMFDTIVRYSCHSALRLAIQ